MALYRKKPVVIEAMQFDGSVQSAQDICNWANKDLSWGEPIVDYVTFDGLVAEDVFVHTLEGDMFVNPNDWVIKGVKGEFYPCKPDIFEATYDSVNEE